MAAVNASAADSHAALALNLTKAAAGAALAIADRNASFALNETGNGSALGAVVVESLAAGARAGGNHSDDSLHLPHHGALLDPHHPHPWQHSAQLHHGHPMPHQPAPFAAVLTFYAVLVTMVMAQTGLFWWKKNHKRSYELVTLFGLWVFPAITCVVLKFWRFLLVWIVFTGITGHLLSLCLAKPMDRTTPRKVYTWFLLLYKVSVGIGSTGYFLLLAFYFLEIFGLHHLVHDVISKVITPTAAVLWIWYGLYFGILGRDCAEVCADQMSKRIGTGRRLAVSVNNCGICGQELRDFTHLGEQAGATEGYEKTVQLACKHLFHSGCIRGWTIVGKKDSCPVCCEKVDLRSLYSDRPWETRNLSWIQMLDAVRYMVVWNPIILIALHGIFSVLGVADHHDPTHPHGAAALGGAHPAAVGGVQGPGGLPAHSM